MDADRSGRRRTAMAVAVLLLVAAGVLLLKGHEGEQPEPQQEPVQVWRPKGKPFAAHEGLVNIARWTPDGRVLTGGRDHIARLWDARGKELVAFVGHRGAVLDVDMSAKGDRVLTASVDGTARLWRPDGTLLAVLSGHSGAVKSARFDANSERILTLGLDGDARLWDHGGKRNDLLQDGNTAIVQALFVRERILTRDASGFVRRFWPHGAPLSDATGDGTLAGLVSGTLHTGPVALGFHTDGRVWLLSVMSPNQDGSGTLEGHAAQVLDADIHRETGRIVTASLDGTVRQWTAPMEPWPVLKHDSAVVRVRFEPGSRRVLTLDAQGVARLWGANGVLVTALDAYDGLRDVGFLAFERPVIWGLPEGAEGLALWNDSGRKITEIETNPGHCGRILDVVPSPDGRRLLLRTADLSARVLRLGPADPEAHEEEISSLESPSDAEAPERGDYLGAAGCAGCHRKEYDLWAASNHGRSLEPTHRDNVPQDVLDQETADHPPGATSFLAHKDEFLARTTGADGKARSYRLGWIAGRARIRMYVAEMDDGRRQVLPGMRSELRDEWFDYTHLLFSPSDTLAAPIVGPGDDAFWTGQGRSWGTKCAPCHSSGAEPRAPHLNGPGPRAVFRDLGVDCEACHGPGRAHAEAWARMETDEPMPKLAGMERAASIQACTRCHMEGERLNAAPVAGEDFYEFLDPTLLLDPDRVDPRGRPLELIYHGLSFGISRCANEGKLTCVRCHDAHGGKLPALLSRPPTNDHLCSECHIDLVRDAQAHSHHDATQSGGTCVGCHMPRLVIERGHGIITDHSLSVPDPEATGDRVAQDACTWCHQMGLGAPDEAPYLGDDALRTAYRTWWPEAQRRQPWMQAIAAGRMQADGATAALTAVAEDTAQYRLVRASATRLLGRQGGSGTQALLRAAQDADPLVRRSALTALAAVRSQAVDALYLAALEDQAPSVRSAAARAALEGWERVKENAPLLKALLPELRREAEALPNDEMRWFRLGAARDVSGDLAGAIEAYERMLGLHPQAQHVRTRLDALRRKLGGAEGR